MLDRKNIHAIAEPAKHTKATTIAVEVDKGQPFFLHSRYNPVKEAQDWLSAVEIAPESAYVVLGFGLGYHVQALLAAIDQKSCLLVVEPFSESSLVNVAPQLIKNSKWLADDRLKFISWSNMRDMAVDLADVLVQQQVYKLVVCPHFPSMQIYPEFYRELYDKLAEWVDNQYFVKVNFGLINTTMLYENAWRNLPYIINCPGIAGFNAKFTNKPAIIVGSGPSLNKNIHLLNECRDSAVIIACGSALRALHKNGVKPHVFASVDPFPQVYDSLKDHLSPEVLLLASYDTCHQLVKEYPGTKLFAETQGLHWLNEIQEYLPHTDLLRKSVSVTSTALHFAVFSGCNPIILVGQDCALSPDETRYSGGIEQYFENIGDRYFEIAGLGGVTLKSPPDLRDMLLYLQSFIKAYPETTFLNATEGGAIIDGAPNRTLASIKQQYLTQGNQIVDTFIDKTVNRTSDQELLTALNKISAEAGEFKQRFTNLPSSFEPFIGELRANAAYRFIKPVIEPFILYCKFKNNEQGLDLQPEIAAIREKSIGLLDVLIDSIAAVEGELTAKPQEEKGGPV